MRRVAVITLALALLTASGAPAASTILVSDVWSRPAVGTGAVYLTIEDRAAASDRLISASSPVARHVELHQTVTAAESSTFAMGSRIIGMPTGAMVMRRVYAVSIPGAGIVHFRPGGYHIMLIGLWHDLVAGQMVPIHLQFARAGWITTQSRVRSM